MGLTKPIEQNLFSYQGTFMYLKDIIRGGIEMKLKDKEGRPVIYILGYLVLLIAVTGLCLADYIPKAQAACEEVQRIQETQWPADEEGMINEYEGIIRFHVIANSNSGEDQALKLKVRNCVLAKVQNRMSESCTAAETRRYIEENLGEIEEWAGQCVRAEGYDYKVAARIGVTAIPAKEYDDVYFPAGNYEALTITIGEGKGHNWWCVIFPPLCLVDARESGHDQLFKEDAEGRLVLKSKVLELLRQGRIKQSKNTKEQD